MKLHPLVIAIRTDIIIALLVYAGKTNWANNLPHPQPNRIEDYYEIG